MAVQTLETDILVIGGGVIGCAAAWHLARAGAAVTVVERDDVNVHASGANAGSLHVQILSRFYKDTTDPLWVRGREIMLPLSVAGVREWQRIAPELDADIDLRVAGGLMVAETDDQLAVLRRKVADERRQGVEVEVVAGSALRDLAPYLTERAIGAAFCPLEGKVNPIAATPALARAARAAGAAFVRGTEVLAIDREGAGFAVRTNMGAMRCGRIVNAAGAWANDVAAMVGQRFTLERHARNMNVTEAVEPALPHLVQHAGERLTLKQAINGNFLIGGGWPATLGGRTNIPWVLPEGPPGNLWIASRLMPALKHLRVIRIWAGLLCFTADGGAILGEAPGVRGFFNAVPGNAGYTLGPLVGRLAAETALGRAPSLDIAPFSIERLPVPA